MKGRVVMIAAGLALIACGSTQAVNATSTPSVAVTATPSPTPAPTTTPTTAPTPDPQSYNDGYAWGNAMTEGVLTKTAPYCSPAEMTSSGPVADPHWFFEKPTGAGEPHDNFAEWSLGCRAGGLTALRDYCAGSSQFCPVIRPTWYRP
jgi:hypothetical protein